ncbi:MAG TPA: stage V sporulation protein SpoVM [Ruminococcus sp.]|nr:stage V sporulation protein SpoVM [Ruminococcus sp.]
MFWCRVAYSIALAVGMGADCSSRSTCYCKLILCTEVITMKVILIQNPKFISAILRKIYGIKKETQK